MEIREKCGRLSRQETQRRREWLGNGEKTIEKRYWTPCGQAGMRPSWPPVVVYGSEDSSRLQPKAWEGESAEICLLTPLSPGCLARRTATDQNREPGCLSAALCGSVISARFDP